MDAPTTPPPPGRGRSEMLKTGIVAIAVALVLRVGLFEPFTIPSASMEPTLLVGDYLVATKFDYGWSRFSSRSPRRCSAGGWPDAPRRGATWSSSDCRATRPSPM